MTRLAGTAIERIAVGEPVLCRKGEVAKAPRGTANGIAPARPRWQRYRGDYWEPGEWLVLNPYEGAERDLQAIADGPIRDPLHLYLPAGRLTEKQYQERLAFEFAEARIAPLDDQQEETRP